MNYRAQGWKGEGLIVRFIPSTKTTTTVGLEPRFPQPTPPEGAVTVTVDLTLPRWSQQIWMANAECRGQTHIFFPAQAERPQARLRREAVARELCAECPAADACRAYARLHREHGFWGGETEEERVLAGYSPPHPIGIPRLRRVG